MEKMRSIGIILALLVMMTLAPAMAQDSVMVNDQTPESIEVSLRVETDDTSVPLNRTLDIRFVLAWAGEPDRVEVLPFDNPILNNFEIVANSSANRVTSSNGVTHAVREYLFTLKPKAMGMGYVEGQVIRYTDLRTDTDFSLSTNRLEIKVTDPLPDPADKSWIIWLLAGLLLAGGAVYLALWFRRRAAEKREQARLKAEQERPVEETFLKRLKNEIGLSDPALDVVEGIAKVTRLTRQFIASRHQVETDGKATEDITRELNALDADPQYKMDLADILTSGDVIKFSGSGATRQELERLYGLLEHNLLKALQMPGGTNMEKTS